MRWSVLQLIMNLIGMGATAWWMVLDPTWFNVLANLAWIAAAATAGYSCVTRWRTIRIRREIARVQAEHDAWLASLHRTYWMQDEMRRIEDETDR